MARGCLEVRLGCVGEVAASGQYNSPIYVRSARSAESQLLGDKILTDAMVGMAVTGSGSAMPAAALDNHALSNLVETSDDWVTTRTGIRQRRVAGPTESLVQLSALAAREAIAMAGLTPKDLDAIVLATSTPDDLFGSAGKIQKELEAPQAVAFDLTAACSGFLFGLVTIAQFLRTGTYRNALVIGADILSRWVDWRDRRTCVLFGDGAGAVVVQATSDRDRLLGFELRSDGSQNDCLQLPYQGKPYHLVDEVDITQGNYQPIFMNGKEVFRFAVKRVPEAIEKALFRAQMDIEQVDWLLLHQANQRILDAVGDRLQVPSEKILSNLATYGNTSAASIPIVLDEAVRADKIQPGDVIAASGFGAGLSWGAAIFEWGR